MILADSSFLYAVYNSRDTRHLQAINWALNLTDIVLIPDVILPEVSYLFLRDVGHSGVIQFLAQLKQAPFPLASLISTDLDRIHETMEQYADSKLDFVDCAIMSISERLNITQIATFDRRDFSIFRPKHCDYLTLLP